MAQSEKLCAEDIGPFGVSARAPAWSCPAHPHCCACMPPHPGVGGSETGAVFPLGGWSCSLTASPTGQPTQRGGLAEQSLVCLAGPLGQLPGHTQADAPARLEAGTLRSAERLFIKACLGKP